MAEIKKNPTDVLNEELQRVAKERSDILSCIDEFTERLGNLKRKIEETSQKYEQACTNYETQVEKAKQELGDLISTTKADREKQRTKNGADIAAKKKELQELEGKLIDLKKDKVDRVQFLANEAQTGLRNMQQCIEHCV